MPEVSVHPANAHLVGIHDPAMLAQCGAQAFDRFNPRTRIQFYENFKAYGHINAPQRDTATHARQELEAKALHALATGADVEVAPDGTMRPASLTAAQRARYQADMDGSTPAPAPKPKGLRREELPLQFRDLRGAALCSAVSRVEQADIARQALADAAAGRKRLSALDIERHEETVRMGGGGSTREVVS